MSKQLADLLLKERMITPQQMADAQAWVTANSRDGKGYIRFLIEHHHVTEAKLVQYLSHRFGLTSINLSKFEISADVIKLIPQELARKVGCIPIQSSKGVLVVAVSDPTAIHALEDVKFRTKLNVEAVLTSPLVLEQAFQKYYGGVINAGSAIESFRRTEKSKTTSTDDALSVELVQVHEIDSGVSEQDAPVIALVNSIFSEAIRRQASDIHVEPYEKRFRVRMRIDGSLVELIQIPTEMKRAVIARFKIMSRMDIAESRIPQDGRIKLKSSGSEIDFRVSTMPTLFGEKVVLRMLSKGNLQLDLTKLGFEPAQLEVFKRGIYSPNGMVLVTGPTGSGKTTTLYSALSDLNKSSDNLSTVEDPVEYNLEGINQVQVQKEIGLTFASVLRTLLRQDPDIVLVGEIRDYETAEVAIQAALTGHLVLSTIHTNDAPSTITRLMNMGIEPFLVVASLNTIVAQRLIRKVCARCKVEQPMPRERLAKVGFSDAELAQSFKVFHGKGCQACNNTGYKGRIAIYEILDVSPTIREMVLSGQSVMELRKQAIREGMKSLRMAALSKVVEGATSLEEALSITMEG